jgi:hypothetical protein
MRTFEPQAGMCSCQGGRSVFALMVALGSSVCLYVLPAGGQTLQDFFTNRETILSVSGQIERSNNNATFEAGEPKHGGKPGGHSLWISWIAPTNGVVQFKTETSRFDTLLSAYQFTNATGSTFADLREVSRADDSEGFEHESEIEFGVLAGERYEIAVDGYYGAVGKVEFRWEFNPLPVLPAQILSSPADRSVNVGDTVTLSVNVTNAANGQLKWVFNGNDLAVTTPNLVIPNFQSTNVGRYELRVSFNGGLRFFSVPTEVQINTDGASNTLAQAKILDSTSTPLIGGDGAGLRVSAFGGGIVASGGGAAGLLRGYNGSQIFNTTFAVVDTNEPPHCGVAGGKSYWLFYQPPTNGTVTLDTLGSTYDTVMEVYTFNGALVGYQDLVSLDCANDSFGTNGPSRVQVPVVKSRQYVVVVAGVNGASGTAWLNYNLNATELPQPPKLTGVPPPRTVGAGSTVVLTAPVTGSLPLAFLWRKDNVLLPGQTAPALVLDNVTNTHTGIYSFTVTNDVGTASGTFALKVVVAPQCLLTRITDGMQLSFATFAGQTYTIEQSTNVLRDWIPWPGSFVGNGLTNYFNVGNVGTKFYRVRVE